MRSPGGVTQSTAAAASLQYPSGSARLRLNSASYVLMSTGRYTVVYAWTRGERRRGGRRGGRRTHRPTAGSHRGGGGAPRPLRGGGGAVLFPRPHPARGALWGGHFSRFRRRGRPQRG